MTTVLSNPDITDDERRTRLYGGQVMVYSASPESLALVEHARDLIAEAFGSKDPQTAQHDMPVEDFAALLAELKPKFIHHPESKELIKALLASFRCDLDRTYFDVPRMRTSTSDDYLVSGISYAFHPHRDTWYSAPFCQLNWWIPIFPVVPENVMAFHPQYWGNPLRNGSRRYNYYEWNRTSRLTAAQHIKTDTRDQPKPGGTGATRSPGARRARGRRRDDLLRQPAALNGAKHVGEDQFQHRLSHREHR